MQYSSMQFGKTKLLIGDLALAVQQFYPDEFEYYIRESSLLAVAKLIGKNTENTVEIFSRPNIL